MDAAAVDRFFDRASEALPTYVSSMPAMLAGLGVATVVFLQGAYIVNDDRRENATSKDVVKRYRWVLLLGVLLGVCGMLSDFVQDRVYAMHMLKLNKQHFANVHWLRHYVRACTA